MIVYPNCKINIGLNIIGKRLDGFHDLESVFYPIPLKDILEINSSKEFKFTSSGLSIDCPLEDNLIYKAFVLIQEKYNIGNVHIHIHKVIPMGAGLGGGSANAAFTLIGLNDLFNLKIEESELLKMAEMLGSDCPFFIRNKPCFVKGRGEILEPMTLDLKDFWIKIINPGIHISTKKAFEGIRIDRTLNLKEEIKKPIKDWGKVQNNFEENIFREFPMLSKIKIDLINEGASYVAMTGTGASIYGLFETKPAKSNSSHFEFTSRL